MDTKYSQGSKNTERTFLFPLYQFHDLTNIQKFSVLQLKKVLGILITNNLIRLIQLKELAFNYMLVLFSLMLRIIIQSDTLYWNFHRSSMLSLEIDLIKRFLSFYTLTIVWEKDVFSSHSLSNIFMDNKSHDPLDGLNCQFLRFSAVN